ncbi:hypothetical protein KY284_020222 [Solanum tuberosum]|nr:hypothetical protein KY284_020222 [Solanum tuberosum]
MVLSIPHPGKAASAKTISATLILAIRTKQIEERLFLTAVFTLEYRELRWIDLLVLPQHREKEKDRLFQATKSGESREEMLHTGVEGLHIERVK